MAAFALGFGLTVSTQARSGQRDQSRRREQPKDDHPRLPPGEGRDVMIRICSQCHSPDSAADQQLDAEGWQALVSLMVEIGAQISPQEFDQTVHYLAQAFPPGK